MTEKHAFKHQVFKGSLWSFVSAAGRQGFGLIVFIILSRLLSPTDFGLMAMSVAVVELLSLVAALGLGAGLIRHQNLSQEDKSTAFWLVCASGLTMSALIFFNAGWLSVTFNHPQLQPILQTLAIMPFLQSLVAVPESLLQKDMAFKSLALRTLASTSGAGVVSIAMAFMGFGVYSLVFQRIATLAINAFAVWRMSKWLPSRVFSGASARSQLRMGVSLLGAGFVNMASLRSLDLITGFFLGPAAVGYLRVAGKLNDFIVQFLVDPIVRVALSSFSKVQDDTAAVARMYRRLTQFCALLTFPAFLGLAVLAPDVVKLVFGEKWAVSGQLMQILCLASLGATLNYFFTPLMSALGKPGELFKGKLLLLVLTVPVTLAAAQVGVHAVMAGFVAVNLLITVYNLLQVRRHIGLTLRSTARVFLPPVVSSLAMAGVVLGLAWLLARVAFFAALPVVHVGLLVLAGGLTYAGILLLLFPAYVADVKKQLLPLLRRKGLPV